MRTKYRGNAHLSNSAQNGQSLMPLAGITIPTVCLGRNISKPATETKGQTVRPSSRALETLPEKLEWTFWS